MTERGLAYALKALEAAGPRLVVVGGTAHGLFLLHEQGQDPGFTPLTTEDIDVAASLELQFDGGLDLGTKLEAAGFREEVEGVDEPAYTYRPSDGGGSYLQFIAPRTGSGTRRDGRPDRLLHFSGIHAEKLRHVDVLLHQPWRCGTKVDGVDVQLWVANPVAFLVQKLLVLQHRRDKRAKDLLYVFDTLAIFGDALTELGAAAADLVRPLSRPAANTIRNKAHELCCRESDVSRDAAAIAAGQRSNPPESAQIVGACKAGLPRVLGNLVEGL